MTIEDVEGEWVNSLDMRDKNMQRPDVLHHCSFAQFARMYSTCKTPKQGDAADTIEDVEQPYEADKNNLRSLSNQKQPGTLFRFWPDERACAVRRGKSNFKKEATWKGPYGSKKIPTN